MRKITDKAVNKFINKEAFRSGNTKIEVREGISYFYLYDNCIAILDNEELFISTCGWETKTTKERLNGILFKVLGSSYQIRQKNFVWYIKDEPLNGTKVFNLKDFR
jgi:hypothetical protein